MNLSSPTKDILDKAIGTLAGYSAFMEQAAEGRKPSEARQLSSQAKAIDRLCQRLLREWMQNNRRKF